MSSEIYMDEIDGVEFEQDALANATAVLVWLKENKPTNVSEVDELVGLIASSDDDVDVYGHRYGIKKWNDSTFVFGGSRMLVMQGDGIRDYMLELLIGIKEELNTVSDHAVGLAA